MNVLVAAVSAPASISGVQRHAVNVVRCLRTQPEVRKVHLVLGAWQREMAAYFAEDDQVFVEIADVGRGVLARNVWFYRELPRVARRLQADVVHLAYPVGIDRAAMRVPTVVTLHDLYPYEEPRNFGFPKVLFHRLILRQCLRQADSIACVSEATREGMLKYFPLRIRSRAERIYNCADWTEGGDELRDVRGYPKPFFLCVAQHRHNKNLVTLVEAYARWRACAEEARDAVLVIVGMRGPVTAELEKSVAAMGLRANVLLLDGLSDAALRWFYEHCELVIAPSTTEGFGFPVVEALQHGCRVVCSDIAAFREIGDGLCRFVPLGRDAVEFLALAIAGSLRELKPKRRLFPQFAAEIIGEQYVAMYRRLLAQRGVMEAPRGAARPLAVRER